MPAAAKASRASGSRRRRGVTLSSSVAELGRALDLVGRLAEALEGGDGLLGGEAEAVPAVAGATRPGGRRRGCDRRRRCADRRA